MAGPVYLTGGLMRMHSYECPVCHRAGAPCSAQELPPAPGDVVLCLSCLCWLLILRTPGRMRLLSDAEWLHCFTVTERIQMTDVRDRIQQEQRKAEMYGRME